MQLLFSVIDELYSFALESILGLFRAVSSIVKDEKQSVVYALEAPVTSTNVAIEVEAPVEEDTTFRSMEALLKKNHVEPLTEENNVVMYVGTNEVALYMKPTQEFDTCLGTLRYGDMVMVLEQRGRWANVVCGTLEGWVLREDLVDRAAYVYPEFVIGQENGVDDPNTVRVRAMIGDMFGGAKIEFPLQAGEYVMYRFKRKGLTIHWGEKRPRVPGLWHTLLKGVQGIHMGITPKTGSIMEYVFKDEIGHVAYVEAVFPDETIHISETNYPDRGIYNERIITREEWRELKPIFIQVS